MPNSALHNAGRAQPVSTSWPSSAPTAGPALWYGSFIDRLFKSGLQAIAVSSEPKHPYSPLTSVVEGYIPNDKTVLALLLQFGTLCLIILGGTWYGLSRWKPYLSHPEKRIVLWFVLTGCLHTFFEGYFVYNNGRMPSRMDLLGQLWKEYALSDSRYLTRDTFVFSIEAITALVWGPLSFFTAYLVATSDPLRHSLQTIVSVAHIYGCVLYFATATVDSHWKSISHSRPEFLYFWVYYVGLNFVFIAIPSYLLYESVAESQSAFAAIDRMRRSSQEYRKASRAEAAVRNGERKKSK